MATINETGGDHYKKCNIQPIEYATKNNLGFVEGNIIKYVTRYKNKNGLEDLLKARDNLDYLIANYEEEQNED